MRVPVRLFAVTLLVATVVGGALDARAVAPGGGLITLLAGTGVVGGTSGAGRVATTASLGHVGSAVADAYGNVFLTDTDACTIRKVDLAGLLSTIAGDGTCGYADGGGSALAARLSAPTGLALDAAGNVVVADAGNCLVRRLTTDGHLSIVAGTEPVAGAPQCGYDGEGVAATGARLRDPEHLAFDAAGNLAITEPADCVVRRVNVKVSPPTVTTVAGVVPGASGATCAAGGEIVRALGAPLLAPAGIAYDAAGNLFIAERGANRVRRVGAGGTIWTVVGGGTSAAVGVAPYGDGGAPTLAALAAPTSVATDPSGTLFIADGGHCRVRSLAGSTLTTVAGSSCGNGGDRGAATSAQLSSLASVSVDRGGDVVIADAGNAQVWRVDGIAAATAGGAQHSVLVDQFRTYGNAATGDNWSGGDATYSLVLPGGRVLWLFADSWIGGSVGGDHARTGQLLVHNQVVIQDSATSPVLRNAFRPGADGEAVFVPTDPASVWWPAAPVLVDSSTVQVTLRRVDAKTGAIIGVDLATIRLDPFDVTALDTTFGAKAWVPSSCPNGAPTDHTQFGAATTSDGTYTYVYGIENCVLAGDFLSSRGYMHLARVPGTDLNGTWEYYAGGGAGGGGPTWSLAAMDSARLAVQGSPNVAGEEYSVVRTASGTYRMVTSALTIGGIKVFTAPSPEGPWTLSSTVWAQTPETNQVAYGDTAAPGTECRLWTYGTKEHPAFDAGGRVAISYNVGLSGCADGQRVLDQFANVDNYRPRFVTSG